jgi:predicted permease
MSKIGFYLLLPAITFVKVAEAVDASVLREWWPLAANLCFSIFLGAALGFAGSYAVRTPAHLRRTVVVASSIGNINTIPLLVVASLCQSDDLMFNEVLGNTCSTKGIAYVAVGMAVGSVFHHSIAFHMLKPPKGHHHEIADAAGTPGTRRRRSDGPGRASGRGASGGGGGGGAMLGPPPPPSDATAIVIRPPLPHQPPPPPLCHAAECKHCGAPCLEEEDAETGGRRVSYAPTLATTGDGGFNKNDDENELDGENGNGDDDDDDGDDRRSSVSSWLSDDMFCGLETLSEAVHFLHTPHSTAKGLHHGLHWGNRSAGNGNGGARPATPAPFARSASNAALHHSAAAAARRSRQFSAPETVGDEARSPKVGGSGNGGSPNGEKGDAAAAGSNGARPPAPGGGGGGGGGGGSLESTLTSSSMARAASSHVPGSLASAAAAAAATGYHPSVFEHPNRQQQNANSSSFSASSPPAPAPAPPRYPAVVMLSADSADAAAAAAAAAVAGDGSDPLPFGGRLAAITTTQSHEPGGNGDRKGTSVCRECSGDGGGEKGNNGNNNNSSSSSQQQQHHLHHRRRSLSMTSGGERTSSSSSSSLGGDVPIGGGGGGGRGGGKKGGGNNNNNNNGALAPSSSRFHSSSTNPFKAALEAAWHLTQPLRSLLWFLLRPLFLALAFVEKMLPVPAIISLAGIGVGCCPPLKRLLFGAHAPLEFVAHSLHTISGATVPVMSFILGAVLYRGPGKAKVPKRVLWGVILVRLVLVPVLGGLAVIYAERAHWFRPVDPLFMFTLVSSSRSSSSRRRSNRAVCSWIWFFDRERKRERKKKTHLKKKTFKKKNSTTAPPRHRPDGDQHAGHRDDVPLQRGRDGSPHLLAAPGVPRDAAAVHLRVRGSFCC